VKSTQAGFFPQYGQVGGVSGVFLPEPMPTTLVTAASPLRK
jgi:hypothetical protein